MSTWMKSIFYTYILPKARLPNSDVSLQQQIIHECHDALYAGQFVSAKTLARIQHQFHWQGIHEDVALYCNTCVSCIRNDKPSNRKPAGLLNPFPTPLIPWFVISMDFITHLPKTDDGYDCIMVVIDKFSKRASSLHSNNK